MVVITQMTPTIGRFRLFTVASISMCSNVTVIVIGDNSIMEEKRQRAEAREAARHVEWNGATEQQKWKIILRVYFISQSCLALALIDSICICNSVDDEWQRFVLK
jgi:hypothetical protein